MKNLLTSAILIRWMLPLSIFLLVPACADNKPSIEEQDACFDEYIDMYKQEYPEATLQKTAALKCYQ